MDVIVPPKTCLVCLRKLRKCELGKPEDCDHLFCFSCLYEWSKNVNTCPVDRVKFNVIRVYRGTEFIRKVYVPDRSLDQVLIDPYDVTYCEVCGECTREHRLLLCDGCDKGYHMECLTVPLKKVPKGNWYCSHCEPIVNATVRLSRGASMSSDESSDSEMDSTCTSFGVSSAGPTVESMSMLRSNSKANLADANESTSCDEQEGFSKKQNSPISISSDDDDEKLSIVPACETRSRHKRKSCSSDSDYAHKQSACIGQPCKKRAVGGSSGTCSSKQTLSESWYKRATPLSKARTAASGRSSISIRQAVIASHQQKKIEDGVLVVQDYAKQAWRRRMLAKMAARHFPGIQQNENLTIPKLCNTPMRHINKSFSKPTPQSGPVESTTLQPSVQCLQKRINMTPKRCGSLRPEKLDLSTSSTTDYVSEIFQNIDNLQAKEHIVHRDGSVEAVTYKAMKRQSSEESSKSGDSAPSCELVKFDLPHEDTSFAQQYLNYDSFSVSDNDDDNACCARALVYRRHGNHAFQFLLSRSLVPDTSLELCSDTHSNLTDHILSKPECLHASKPLFSSLHSSSSSLPSHSYSNNFNEYYNTTPSPFFPVENFSDDASPTSIFSSNSQHHDHTNHHSINCSPLAESVNIPFHQSVDKSTTHRRVIWKPNVGLLIQCSGVGFNETNPEQQTPLLESESHYASMSYMPSQECSAYQSIYSESCPTEEQGEQDTLLDSHHASEFVLELLEFYCKQGYIKAKYIDKIKAKALKKIEVTTVMVKKSRVQKLIRDYIQIYQTCA